MSEFLKYCTKKDFERYHLLTLVISVQQQSESDVSVNVLQNQVWQLRESITAELMSLPAEQNKPQPISSSAETEQSNVHAYELQRYNNIHSTIKVISDDKC